MLQQRVLHIPRKDVEAAADDQVLLAVDYIQIAVRVEVADVPGVQSAAPHRAGGFRGGLPIASHHPFGSNADFSIGAGRQVPPTVVPDHHPVAAYGLVWAGMGSPTEPGRYAPGGVVEITAPDSVQP